jgi:hypothetical protein
MLKIIIHLQFCPLGHPLARGKPPLTHQGFLFLFCGFKKLVNFSHFLVILFKLSKITKKKKLSGHPKAF